MYNSIKPGQIWLDTEGKRIQAHGGSVMYLDGTYYWYGENKEKTTGKDNIWHWGVRCYTSKDLYNWEDKGLIIPPETADPDSSLHPTSMMDRPHIIYNKGTGKFVCWLKIMNKDGTQSETILTADHILGPYKKVREGFRPLNMSARGFRPCSGTGWESILLFRTCTQRDNLCGSDGRLHRCDRLLYHSFSKQISAVCQRGNLSFCEKRKALSDHIRNQWVSAEPI